MSFVERGFVPGVSFIRGSTVYTEFSPPCSVFGSASIILLVLLTGKLNTAEVYEIIIVYSTPAKMFM